jgi:hypothetical protein
MADLAKQETCRLAGARLPGSQGRYFSVSVIGNSCPFGTADGRSIIAGQIGDEDTNQLKLLSL